LDEVRRATLDDFKQQSFHFSDSRYNQLLFSYRARYFAQSLTAEEQKIWFDSCKWRLTDENSGYLTLQQQGSEINQLLADRGLSEEKRAVLLTLQQWSGNIAAEFGLSN
jgi:exodeoxyribonuclease-1